MKNMKNITIALMSLSFLMVACKSTKDVTVTEIKPGPTVGPTTTPTGLDCSTSTLTYKNDIQGIIESNCTKCHNTNNKAGYNFLTLESVKKAANNGYLLGSIKHAKGYDEMPAYASKMSQDLIDKIECWITSGMAE